MRLRRCASSSNRITSSTLNNSRRDRTEPSSLASKKKHPKNSKIRYSRNAKSEEKIDSSRRKPLRKHYSRILGKFHRLTKMLMLYLLVLNSTRLSLTIKARLNESSINSIPLNRTSTRNNSSSMMTKVMVKTIRAAAENLKTGN